MAYRYPDGEIIVMARAPQAGQTKTRLIPALGAEGAAQLHRFMVERLLTELTQSRLAKMTLCCTPDTHHRFFHDCRQRFGVSLRTQQGADLGERLHHALATALQESRFAIVVGCDIPTLGGCDIRAAFDALLQGHQAAVSPTEDGGYALLGVSELARELFEGIEWGTTEVFAQTRQRLRQLNWSWQSLPLLWDVDRPADLHRLMELQLPEKMRYLLGESTA